MKQLIVDEINQIENLEERILFKELMNQVFLSLYENNQEMYQALEDKVFHEISYNRNQFSVITGLMEKKYFDASHHIFSPMLDKDMNTVVLNLNQIMEALKEQQSYKVMQVFLECDYLKIKEILSDDQVFSGSVKTEKGNYHAEFKVCQNREYIGQVEHLYQMFIRNGVRWHTVNAPYVNKIADVYMTKCDAELDEDTIIEEVSVEFLEFGQYVKYDRIPVWNITRQQVDSVGFPRACEENKSYEHKVSLTKLKNECGFLVENMDLEVQGVQKVKDQLYIRVDCDKVAKWDLLIIRNWESKRIDHFTYPILGNLRKISFTERLYEQNQISIKTNAELIRYIESYELSDYVTYDHYEIIDEDGEKTETYSMNPFIIDEIRQRDAKKKMMIYMRKKEERFINRDILSFLTTEIQILYPEYECEGRLI